MARSIQFFIFLIGKDSKEEMDDEAMKERIVRKGQQGKDR